jgi:hypothetical protein
MPVTAALRGALSVCGFWNGTADLRMSREWLKEHERRARTNPNGF